MTEKKGWFSRLKQGLKKTSDKISDGIGAIFVRRKLDDEALEELEELLLSADLGVHTTSQVMAALRKTRFGQDVTDEEVRTFLSEELAHILSPYACPLKIEPGKTNLILMVGVNGSGKTTTLSKLAAAWKEQGYRIRMVAGDTFRAAAVSQLKIWGERLKVPVVSGADKADAAGLIFDAYQQAQREKDDILLVDTAGRLHNREDLMAELEKIVRVIKKIDPEAPHHSVIVVDATIGQNIYAQIETFRKWTPITGIVMTKLDGTAKGGVLVGLAERFKLPIHAIGIGEAAEDLKSFDAHEFARSLVGEKNSDNRESISSGKS